MNLDTNIPGIVDWDPHEHAWQYDTPEWRALFAISLLSASDDVLTTLWLTLGVREIWRMVDAELDRRSLLEDMQRLGRHVIIRQNS